MEEEFEFTYYHKLKTSGYDKIRVIATTSEGKDFMRTICKMILNGEIKCNTINQ